MQPGIALETGSAFNGGVVYHGKASLWVYKTLNVYAKRSGRWQFVATHSCHYS